MTQLSEEQSEFRNRLYNHVDTLRQQGYTLPGIGGGYAQLTEFVRKMFGISNWGDLTADQLRYFLNHLDSLNKLGADEFAEFIAEEVLPGSGVMLSDRKLEAKAKARTEAALAAQVIEKSNVPPAEGDIQILLFGGLRFYPGTGGRGCVKNDFNPMNMDLLDFLNRNKEAVRIRFAYPENFRDAVNIAYEHLGKGQKCDIAPGLADSKWGPSATLTMPTPPLDRLVNYPKALEEARKGKATIIFDDLRLACQLRFYYGFNWYGLSWEVYNKQQIMRGGN